MKLRCDHCAAIHELDPPAWVLGSGRPFRFRCSSCAHSQVVSAEDLLAPEQTTVVAAPVAPAAPAREPEEQATVVSSAPPRPLEGAEASERRVLVRADGRVHEFASWEALREAVAAGGVATHALVSDDGSRWSALADHPSAGLLGSALRPISEAPTARADMLPREETSEELRTPFPFEDFTFGGEAPFGLGGPEEVEPERAPPPSPPPARGGGEPDGEGVPVGLPPLGAGVAPDPSAGPPGLWDPGQPPSTAPPLFAEGDTLDEPIDDAIVPGEVEFEQDEGESPVGNDAAVVSGASPPFGSATADTAPLPPLPAAPQPSTPPRGQASVTLDPGRRDPSTSGDWGRAGQGDEYTSGFDHERLFREFDGEAPSTSSGVQHIPASRTPAWLFPLLAFLTLLVVLGLVWWMLPEGAPERVQPQASLSDALPSGTPPPAAPAEPSKFVVEAPAEPIEPAESTQPASPPAASPGSVVVAPEPAAPAPAAPPSPAPVKAPAAAPSPAVPKVTASPKASAPRASGNADRLSAKGWGEADKGDLDAAGRSFRAALDASPDHPDASYGLGYVLANQGRAVEARPYLCTAVRGLRDIESQREAKAVLRRFELSCP